MSHVCFLDTKVKFNAHTLATELYSKPSASFQYPRRTSFHPPHTFRSVLKSQFIRIRRICTDINHYWNHSQQFITFFKSRGFHDTILNKICQDIANTPCRNPFRNINGTLLNAMLTPNKSNRIALVTTWYHKLSGFQSILQNHLYYPSDEIKLMELPHSFMPYQTYSKHSFHSWLQYSMFTQTRQRLQTLSCYEQHKFYN